MIEYLIGLTMVMLTAFAFGCWIENSKDVKVKEKSEDAEVTGIDMEV